MNPVSKKQKAAVEPTTTTSEQPKPAPVETKAPEAPKSETTAKPTEPQKPKEVDQTGEGVHGARRRSASGAAD